MYQQRKKMHKVFAAVLALVGFATLGVGVQPASAYDASNMCDFAVFIGVRGTSAPAGANLVHSNRLWRAGGLGDQIAPLRNRVDDEVYGVWSASLNYPASTNYESSVAAGANTLAAELNYLSTACGTYMPAVILAGHSQGADVIGRALGWGNWPQGVQLTSKAKAMISAVVLYGDPGFFPGDPWNAPGSPSGLGVYTRNAVVKDQLATFRYWGWSQENTSPNPGWVSKIRSYCYAGDFFCQSNPADGGFTIHNSYKSSTQVSKAAGWIYHMVTSSN